MKVEVLKSFYDLQMKTLHRKGDLIDITEERAVQIMTVLSGHIKVVDGIETKQDLSQMTKKELLSYAESRGISVDTRMNKTQIIEALEV